MNQRQGIQTVLNSLVLQYDAEVRKGTSAHAKDEGAHPSGQGAEGVSLTPAAFSSQNGVFTMAKERITIAVAMDAR